MTGVVRRRGLISQSAAGIVVTQVTVGEGAVIGQWAATGTLNPEEAFKAILTRDEFQFVTN